MADDIAIKVENVFKTFILPHEKHSTLKSALINFGRSKRGYEKQQVLNDISFEIKKGEFFGIVGRNGSGKSTLLKLLAGIYTPDKGSITINGKLTPFIELGVGFNPELSGRENVFLNGALLGFTRKEMEAMYDEIVEFAELERFMDQKLKNYSSGMQVRLAFSIAIRANTDILVLDEVLAVGDEAFQRKCNDYFSTAKKSGKTVVLVTHDMEAVRKYCNKAILINEGQVKAAGNPNKIADKYSLENFEQVRKPGEKHEEVNESKPWIRAQFVSRQLLTRSDELVIEATYKTVDTKPVLIKFAPLSYGASLMTANSKVLNGITTRDTKEHKVQYRLPLKDFNNGNYTVVVLLADSETGTNIADYGYGNELPFKVSDSDTRAGGAFVNQGKIKFLK